MFGTNCVSKSLGTTTVMTRTAALLPQQSCIADDEHFGFFVLDPHPPLTPPPPLPTRSDKAEGLRQRTSVLPTARRKAPAIPPPEETAELDPVLQNKRNEEIVVWVRRDEEDRLSPPLGTVDSRVPPLLPRRVPLRQLSPSSVTTRSVSLHRNFPVTSNALVVVPVTCKGCRLIEEQQRQRQNATTPASMPVALTSQRSEIDLVSLDRWPIGQDSPPTGRSASPSPLGRSPRDHHHQLPARQDNEYVPEPFVASSTLTTNSTVLPRRALSASCHRTLATLEPPSPVNHVNLRASSPHPVLLQTCKSSSTEVSVSTVASAVKDNRLLDQRQSIGITCKSCGGCRCKACRNSERRRCTDRIFCTRKHLDNNDDDDSKCLDADGQRHQTSPRCKTRSCCFLPCFCWPVRGTLTSCYRQNPNICRCPGVDV